MMLDSMMLTLTYKVIMYYISQEVQPNSPASLAGLRSDSDYIIGADTMLTEVSRRYKI